MPLSFADFSTIRELGTGSFGSVTLVKKRDTGQVMAMKTVPLTRLNQKEKDNALNQVRLLASIEIPNVIAFKGSFFEETTNSLCILMEYADGGDLQAKAKDLMAMQKSEGFEQKFVWKVAYELLQGLKTLHAHKIVHRDLKSANIFFVEGVAKLGDMNVSKVVEAGMMSTQTGTPYYTSPEIWKGEQYDSKCDVWSVGVLLYEMCCLKMPFTARDFPSLYRRVVEGNYTPLSQYYSAEMHNLVRMCLIVEPQMRPSAAELLQTTILKGMEMSLSSFHAEEGHVKLIDPIQCPKVLKFLASKLPKPRLEAKRVAFETPKKVARDDSTFKIKSVRKIRSEKHITMDNDSEVKDSKVIHRTRKLEKVSSKKRIEVSHNQSMPQEESKLEKVGSKKSLKLPPLEGAGESKVLMSPNFKAESPVKGYYKRSAASNKVIKSSKNIPSWEKEN